jgi:uncharacterized membrane protein
MAIAVISLLGMLLASYLHLYKLGLVGDISCTTGGCAKAIFSTWGSFLGVDVGLIGAIGYALLLGVSLLSLQPRFASARWPVTLLLVLATLGFVFTLRLKYGEFVVLQTFCKWCAGSAVAITLIYLLSIVEWRRTAARAASPDVLRPGDARLS